MGKASERRAPPGSGDGGRSPPGLEAILFRRWRRGSGRTIAAAARDLGVSQRTISRFEAGERPIPRAILLAVRALDASLPPLCPPDPASRERWAQVVADMRAYAAGEAVVGYLLKSREFGRLREFLALVASGPETRMALTDPALFRMLSEAVLKARLAGLAEYRIDERQAARFAAIPGGVR